MTDKSPTEQGLVIVGKRRANTSEGAARRAGITRDKLPRLSFAGTLAFAASSLPGGKKTFMEFVRLASKRDDSLVELVGTR
jgi:hypothetical protein